MSEDWPRLFRGSILCLRELLLVGLTRQGLSDLSSFFGCELGDLLISIGRIIPTRSIHN